MIGDARNIPDIPAMVPAMKMSIMQMSGLSFACEPMIRGNNITP